MIWGLNNFNERKDFISIPSPNLKPTSTPIKYYPKQLITANNLISWSNLVLSFNSDPNATKYHITLGRGTSGTFDPNFKADLTNIILDTTISDTFFRANPTLFSSQSTLFYYWSVRPINKIYTCTSIPYQAFKTTGMKLTANVTSLKCGGDKNGTITILDTTGLATPKYYVNGTEYPTKNITGLSGGYYTIEVKGATQTVQTGVVISEPSTVNGGVGYGPGKTATITPSGGTSPYTYAWSNGNTNQSISNMSIGDYTVTITDSKGCKSSAIAVKITAQTGGIGGNIILDNFEIYPTRISFNNRINFNQLVLNTNVKIYDIQGKLLKNYTVHNDNGFIWDITFTGKFIIQIENKTMSKSFQIEAIN
jgi:hypothetical protein